MSEVLLWILSASIIFALLCLIFGFPYVEKRHRDQIIAEIRKRKRVYKLDESGTCYRLVEEDEPYRGIAPDGSRVAIITFEIPLSEFDSEETIRNYVTPRSPYPCYDFTVKIEDRTQPENE